MTSASGDDTSGVYAQRPTDGDLLVALGAIRQAAEAFMDKRDPGRSRMHSLGYDRANLRGRSLTGVQTNFLLIFDLAM